MRSALLAALAFGLFAPSAEPADLIVFGDGLGGGSVHITTVPAKVTGSVLVDFRGDPAAGCAAAGLCETSGSLIWNPGEDAEVAVLETRSGERSRVHATLSFAGPTFEGTRVSVSVSRRAADGGVRRCTDARREFVGAEGKTAAGTTTFTFASRSPLIGANLVATNCAGPLFDDVAAALPGASIALADLKAGEQTLSMRREHPFAAGGLAGTVRSTVELALGTPSTRTHRPSSGRSRRHRRLQVSYRIASVTGSVRLSYGPAPDPFPCASLDACGIAGSATLAPALTKGHVDLSVDAPRRRPLKDLRAALGLSARGRTSGLRAYGFGSWTGAGTASATVTRPDGPPCRSESPSAGAAIVLSPRRGRVKGQLILGGLRTRCQGPVPEQLSGSGALATADVALSAFRGRRVVLPFSAGRSFSDDAYAGRTESDLTVTLERVRTRARTVSSESW